MDERTLRVLEFNKVKEMLLLCHETEMGKEMSAQLYPLTELEKVRFLQRQTSEARNLLTVEVNLPSLGGTRDIRAALQRAALGAILEPEQLLNVKQTLGVARQIKVFLLERKEEYPIIAGLATDLFVLKEIEEAIEKSIGEQGEVLDTASAALGDIRRTKKNLSSRIKERMEQILRNADYQKMLQESIITIRSERYVVPIKQEYKNQFPGLVHDQSASGATLFVEPMLIVNLNNDLRRLSLQEKDEIAKILTQLSLKIGQHVVALEETLKALAKIDFVLAKGRLSEEMHAISPVLNNHGFLKIKQARHPLLGEKAVPIDAHLGKEFRVLVITGPNTGGKTVTLKTVGLLTLMTQCGLHIPAGEESVMAVFNKVYSDIGDEQSIEQSLSTFSAHMTYIARILPEINQKSLVLLDELGAGTDPTEGAALAMAILEDLYEKKARVVATTHYSELKNFSYSREGIENASVEFNLETLSPTYRLLIGIPGRSNAFAIAQRLGLAQEVIAQAQDKLAEKDKQMAHVLHNLEETRIQAEQDRLNIEEAKKEIEELKAEYEKKIIKLKERYDKVITRAYQKAEQVVSQTERESRELIEDLKKAQQEKNVQETLRQAKEKLNQMNKEITQKAENKVAPSAALKEKEVSIGLAVYLPKLGQRGEIISLPDSKGEVQVQVGIMRFSLKIAELQKTGKEKTSLKKVSNDHKFTFTKLQNFSPELDLRGLLAEEALEKLDKYLDDAFVAGMKQVNIIHGKGTGALRQAVQQYLKIHPQIESYRLAGLDGGGDGATIVVLSK